MLRLLKKLSRRVYLNEASFSLGALFEKTLSIKVSEVVSHSSPESGPNPKVKNHPESIWNMV